MRELVLILGLVYLAALTRWAIGGLFALDRELARRAPRRAPGRHRYRPGDDCREAMTHD